MYVILLRETHVEGVRVRLHLHEATDKLEDVGSDAVDYAKDSTRASYNNLKDAAQQITEEVIGVVTGILGDALDNLASSVGRLNSTFNSADQNLNKTSNMSTNFEKDVVNSITNNTAYSATTTPLIQLKDGTTASGATIGFGGGGASLKGMAKVEAAAAAARGAVA